MLLDTLHEDCIQRASVGAEKSQLNERLDENKDGVVRVSEVGEKNSVVTDTFRGMLRNEVSLCVRVSVFLSLCVSVCVCL